MALPRIKRADAQTRGFPISKVYEPSMAAFDEVQAWFKEHDCRWTEVRVGRNEYWVVFDKPEYAFEFKMRWLR